MIRDVNLNDADALTTMYNHYIKTSGVTFEETTISSDEMRSRIKKIHFTNDFPFLVYEEDGEVIGYAYATTFRERVAYRFTVESTVYVDPKHFGKGIGRKLYQVLIDQLKEKEYHSVIGVITLPNDPSIQLHESFGFKKVGHFTEVGKKFNRWMDVGFWELILK
jgi:phosphinothricin acetyltransferase